MLPITKMLQMFDHSHSGFLHPKYSILLTFIHLTHAHRISYTFSDTHKQRSIHKLTLWLVNHNGTYRWAFLCTRTAATSLSLSLSQFTDNRTNRSPGLQNPDPLDAGGSSQAYQRSPLDRHRGPSVGLCLLRGSLSVRTVFRNAIWSASHTLTTYQDETNDEKCADSRPLPLSHSQDVMRGGHRKWGGSVSDGGTRCAIRVQRSAEASLALRHSLIVSNPFK